MWEANVMIQTIHVNPRYSQHDLFRRVVVIHLETNQLRPCVRVTLKAFPLAHRAKVVGRTLVSGRTDANYAEVAFPRTTISTTAATRLPTPSTAAATTATDAASFAGFVTSTAAAGLTAAAVSAAKASLNMANDATPIADQNRKAHTAAATATTAQARH
jgi:hypothetical protein